MAHQIDLFCVPQLADTGCLGADHIGGSCDLCRSPLVTSRGGLTGAAERQRPPGRFWIGQAEHLRLPRGLSRRASDVRGDDVGSVAVQGCAGTVIAHGGSRIGVRSRFLHIPQRHTCVQSRGDERVP